MLQTHSICYNKYSKPYINLTWTCHLCCFVKKQTKYAFRCSRWRSASTPLLRWKMFSHLYVLSSSASWLCLLCVQLALSLHPRGESTKDLYFLCASLTLSVFCLYFFPSPCSLLKDISSACKVGADIQYRWIFWLWNASKPFPTWLNLSKLQVQQKLQAKFLLVLRLCKFLLTHRQHGF